MYGRLSEFTLAQLLQFFALAERSGTVTVRAADRTSRLLVEGDRIVGWGLPDFDARETLAACELLPHSVADAVRHVRPYHDTPGLSFVVRNLVEPDRWDAFAQRQLEQDVYPLLSVEEGEFEIEIQRCPPSPLRLSIPINSLILDGSRWESEMEAARLEGFRVDSVWRRSDCATIADTVTLASVDWMLWALLTGPLSIHDAAARLCIPDLTMIGHIRNLRSMGLISRVE